MAVDSVGTGLFVPFAIVYFLHITALPLTLIGAGLTTAYLAALPTPVAVGPLIDRLGPRRMVAAGNLLSAIAFTDYLFVGSLWQLIVAAFVASVGQATFWTATRALIAVIAPPAQRGGWFAMQTTIRNAGYGLGGVLGAAAISAGGRWAYLLLAAVNAVSYLLAATLVLRWKPAMADDPPAHRNDLVPARHEIGPGTYRHLLRDRALVLVTGMNLAFVLCGSAVTVLLAVYLTNVLGLPAWLAGALFTVNTVLVVALQTVTTRHVRRYREGRVLQAAALCWIAAFLLFWALTITPRPLLAAVLLAAIAAFSLAGMLQGPTINTLVVDLAPANAPGRHLAAFQLSWSLGQAAAPLLMIWLLSRGAQWPWIALMAACALVIAAAHIEGAHRMATVSVRYIVSDVDAAIAFYCQQLGFHEDMHPAPAFAMLSRGDLRLVLSAAGGGPGGGQAMPDGRMPEPGGWNRFSLEVSDLASTVEALRKAGARFRNDIVTGVGGKQILVEDPSGNPVELFEPTIPEASLARPS